MKKLSILLLSLTMFFTSCDDDNAVSNTKSTEVKVLSLNMYAGGDLDRLESVVTKDGLVTEMNSIWADVQQNNSPQRIDAIARIIAENGVEVVMLQDAASWYTQSPGDFLEGTMTPNATETVYELPELLIQMLSDTYKIEFTIVSQQTIRDLELPTRIGQSTTSTDYRVQLENLILVRSNINNSGSEESQIFSNDFELEIGDYNLEFKGGYQMINLRKGDIGFTVANAQLMPNDISPVVNRNQAATFVNAVSSQSPLIASIEAKASPSTESYTTLTSELRDGWVANRGTSNGYTCCLDEDLDDNSGLSTRDQYQLYTDSSIQIRSIELIGDDQDEKVENDDKEFISNRYGLLGTYRIIVPN